MKYVMLFDMGDDDGVGMTMWEHVNDETADQIRALLGESNGGGVVSPDAMHLIGAFGTMIPGIAITTDEP